MATIGIIGAGNIGGSLVRLLTARGHTVRVANSRDPQTLAELAQETGAQAVWNHEAAADADVVILSIPQRNVPSLPAGVVAKRKTGAPVIETNNYYPQERDGLIEEIEAGTPESVWVSERIGAPVYKVFNGIFWKHLLDKGAEAGAQGRIALPVAGPAGDGKQRVFELVEELGFDAVDGGSLADSWRQQPGTPVYGKDFGREAAIAALAEASPERTAQWRA